MADYSVVEYGSKYSESYCAFIYSNKLKHAVSPFHDIAPFICKQAYEVTMVVEIPRWTQAKLEINTKSKLNPIKQDIKKGAPRFVANLFPYHGYMWNYGAIPQTWEDPNQIDRHTDSKGDNDPLDIIDIGEEVMKTGDIITVKVIGCIALIDEGETDWKIIAINTRDSRASKINSLNDLNIHFPLLITETIKWFRYYKVPAGSAPNKFAFEGNIVKDRDFAMEVIDEAHLSWKKLVQEQGENCPLSLYGSSDPSYKHYLNPEQVTAILDKCEPKSQDSCIPDHVFKYAHVDIPAE